MTDQEFWAEVRRKEAELEARYEGINQAWLASEIPCFVRETPDWQSGWQVMLDWLRPLEIRAYGKPSEGGGIYLPHSKTAWGKEIHIFSHIYRPGHNFAQAALEEEGMRAILAWWNERAGTDGRPA